ncbi:hypothetical protein ABPG73_011548 [Tetrahymena malaccensis]
MQSTLKQKDLIFDKDDNNVHSIYDQSSDQSSKNYNFDKKKKKMFLNVLSDYFEKDKSLQKINLIQKQLENVQTVIPFKAKYFTRDEASQIIKENQQFNTLKQFYQTMVLKNTSIESVQQEKIDLGFMHDFNNLSCSLFDIFQAIIIPTSFFFWIVDMFIELNTGVLERGELIVDKVYIASKYLRQRLILDLIGIIPIAYYIINPSYKQISVDFLIILKLKHFYQIFSRLEHYLSYQQDKKNLIDLLRLVLLVLITNHLIALLWYRLATFEKNFLGYKQTWIDNLKINANSFMDYYQVAIYFATVTVYTVGYGDISPCTILECSFVTLTIIITGIIFAYAINQIGLIMQNINSSKTILKEDLMIMNKFMQQKNVNQDLRMRIRNYLEHMHRQFQENNSEGQKKVINKISPSLLKEMNQDIYKEFIFSNEIFNQIFSLDFLKSTLDTVEEFVATPGEYLFKEGERDDQSIYFVFQGKVQITLNQQIVQIIKGQSINNKYQLQLKNKNKQNNEAQLQDDDYKLINEFLKKRNMYNKTQKNNKMTNILLENNKKSAFQQEDDFFDLNRLADEQSGKSERRFQTRWGLKSFKPTLNQKYTEGRAQRIQKTHKEDLDLIQQNLDKSVQLDNQSYNNFESQLSSFNQQESSKHQENDKIEENVSDEVSEYQADKNDGQKFIENAIRERKETYYEFQDSKFNSSNFENKNIFKKPSQQRLSSKTTSTKNQKSIQENQFTSQFTQHQQQQQQDEYQVVQYLNEKILQKDQQQQQLLLNNEQYLRKQSLSNKCNIQSYADLPNKIQSMTSFGLKQNNSNIFQHQQPNVSNFVASSIYQKTDIISPIQARKQSDVSKVNISQKDIPYNVGEEFKKENRSLFDYQQSNQKSSTSYSNLQENQISCRSIKDNVNQKQKSRQYDRINNDSKDKNYENNLLFKQFTEHICKQIAYYQKSTLNDREDNSPSMFHRISHSYALGNMTDNSKTYQFDQFEKMKEFTCYFSHNNYSNIILKFNSLQDKKFLQAIQKKQKIKSRKKAFQQKQSTIRQQSYINIKKINKKESEENSVSSFNSQFQIK